MSYDGVDVQLRDVVADLEAFLAYEHDPEAVRRSRFTPRPREAFIRHWKTKTLADESVLVRTVTVDGEVAGNVVSWWDGERRFLGYWLGRAYWGRGVGTEALALFLALEKSRPLYADPFAGNTASIRLLERHGFQRSGAGVDSGDEEDGHVMLVLG
ncbi:GNAT family N-acetyltransferase [Streptomyces sp. TRM68367]|uniref:GNAT family N-acetyltransferase n=1 Tax=Streptomyces sp. TRM68367 TaxID=2758415 RepID=UPI00165B3E64|nr:GNAT family N-acetyltransferase [Streptomyces sp. TRM68367]MBC9723682.1 GNAT family N-acetyltransferase [Streptomyces sp. TRM68367]